MANTKQGIYYQDDYNLVADVPSDMKKMAQSVDTELETDRGRLSKNETDITEIKAKNTAQDTNIATLTQRLTEKDNQIAELEDKVSDLNNNQIYGKASGEYVHLSDSAKMNCDIEVLGNSKQETREGYNLFKTDKITENKYIEMSNGTLFDTSLTNTSDYIEIKANETYIFVYKYSTLLNERNRGYCMFDTDKNYISGNGYAPKDKKIIFNPTQDGYIRISFDKNCTDIMFYKGTEDKEYEPYGAMPSLDYPSEIEVVGDNKNLLQNLATSQTIDGVKFTVNKDGTVIANGTAPTSKHATFIINNKQLSLPAGEYTVSGCPSTYDKQICRIDVWRSDWSNLCNEMGDGGRITLSEDIENLIVGITIFKGETANNLVFKPKIEKGTMATAYSLYGIGGENVKVYNRNLLNTPYNSENKLTDTATSDRYYITTGFKAYLIAGKTYHFKCETNLKFGFASDGGEGLCYLMLNKQANTFFQLLSNDRTITVKESGWYYLRYDIYKANKTASFWNFQLEEGTTATDYIQHEEQNYPVDVQKPMLEGDYFDLENGKEVHNWQKIESYNGEEITTEYKSTTGELSTGATVYYKLSEPRKLDLTDTQKQQLQALQKAKTYKNITNITTDTIAVLDVDYKKDLETYQKQQDDRITAIEQLLSTTATSAMLLDNVQSDLESEVK